LKDLASQTGTALLDVRKPGEFENAHLEGADNVPLDYIGDKPPVLDGDITYYVYCAGGYRSMIFISMLRAKGYRNLVDVKGGFAALKQTGVFKITDAPLEGAVVV
jgi:rhodanese-related sulfurtransferase